MSNRIVIILLISVALGMGFYAQRLYKQKDFLNTLLNQDRDTQVQIKEENKRLASESDDLRKQIEKIQSDSLTYIASTTKLQLENESLQKKISQMIQDTQEKEDLSSSVKTEVDNRQGEEVLKLQKELEDLKYEKAASLARLKKIEVELDLLNISNQQEKGVLYYNLGVAFALAKLYDEAVAAFETAIKCNSVNPMAHYNLGLIFENVKFDNDRAVSHYEQYLAQAPNNSDREEVISWVRKLQ